MKKGFRKGFKAILAFALSCAFIASSAILPLPTKAATRSGFIRGVDVSALHMLEQMGATYRDNGVQNDAITILHNHGANYCRLKLWMNPYDSQGNAYGGGNNDYATTLALALRAKAAGMKIIIDFHLSDFWADPSTQVKPKAWANLSFADLKTAVYQYVQSTMAQFRADGVIPEMVQIGNETSGGMLFPDGKIVNNNFSNLAQLLASAISGVRNVNGTATKVILHLDNGGDNTFYRWWFDGIANSGTTVDYDIIGVTYYPFWHGTMSELQANLNDLSVRYNKDILIVETAYGWTLQDGDGLGNPFNAQLAAIGGYPATVQGQIDYIHDLTDILLGVPNNHGLGYIYWEPDWTPVPGANWGTQAGETYIGHTSILCDTWDNLTLFDFNGNALSSIDIFQTPLPNNLIANPGFEQDGAATSTPSGWSRWSSVPSTLSSIKTEWYAFSGNYKLTFWNNVGYTVSAYQVLNNLSNGNYTFSAWVLNSGGQSTMRLYAKNFGGTEMDQSFPTSSSAWTKVVIKNIPVTNGQCEVGIYSVANANNWCNVDDVMFYKQ